MIFLLEISLYLLSMEVESLFLIKFNISNLDCIILLFFMLLLFFKLNKGFFNRRGIWENPSKYLFFGAYKYSSI